MSKGRVEQSKRVSKRERKRERECVCVCECVLGREGRQRMRKSSIIYPFWHSAGGKLSH